MTIRAEVLALVALGPMPAEDASSVEEIETVERRLHAIAGPVSVDEARLLVQAFPESDASCFGLAWTLLHLVETSRDGLGDAELGSGP